MKKSVKKILLPICFLLPSITMAGHGPSNPLIEELCNNTRNIDLIMHDQYSIKHEEDKGKYPNDPVGQFNDEISFRPGVPILLSMLNNSETAQVYWDCKTNSLKNTFSVFLSAETVFINEDYDMGSTKIEVKKLRINKQSATSMGLSSYYDLVKEQGELVNGSFNAVKIKFSFSKDTFVYEVLYEMDPQYQYSIIRYDSDSDMIAYSGVAKRVVRKSKYAIVEGVDSWEDSGPKWSRIGLSTDVFAASTALRTSSTQKGEQFIRDFVKNESEVDVKTYRSAQYPLISVLEAFGAKIK